MLLCRHGAALLVMRACSDPASGRPAACCARLRPLPRHLTLPPGIPSAAAALPRGAAGRARGRRGHGRRRAHARAEPATAGAHAGLGAGSTHRVHPGDGGRGPCGARGRARPAHLPAEAQRLCQGRARPAHPGRAHPGGLENSWSRPFLPGRWAGGGRAEHAPCVARHAGASCPAAAPGWRAGGPGPSQRTPPVPATLLPRSARSAQRRRRGWCTSCCCRPRPTRSQTRGSWRATCAWVRARGAGACPAVDRMPALLRTLWPRQRLLVWVRCSGGSPAPRPSPQCTALTCTTLPCTPCVRSRGVGGQGPALEARVAARPRPLGAAAALPQPPDGERCRGGPGTG